jgi:hypothetical protein
MSTLPAAIGRLDFRRDHMALQALTSARARGAVRSLAACCVCVYSAACSGTQSTRAPGATAAEVPPGAHDLTCEYVGLESVQGASDANSDSVTLLAVFRFSESQLPPPKAPLSLKFQVERSRVNELRDGLSARPEVICRPHGQDAYAADVTPLPGVRGEPQEEAPP